MLYNNSLILTPSGFKRGDTIRVGDPVNNPDGSVSTVVFMHPKADYQVWRVKFHDGTFTDVAEEHLWLSWKSGARVQRNGTKLFGEPSAEVITTRKLKEWADTAKHQQSVGKRPNWAMIPVCKPQQFAEHGTSRCEIDPYLLGVWLGDGHNSFRDDRETANIGITSEDVEHIVEVLGDADYHIGAKQGTEAKCFKFRGEYLKWFCRELYKCSLVGRDSSNKRVPDDYRFGSMECRLSVLQGLMDTDGYVDGRGQCYYTSISPRLAQDVAFIVRSLGGTANVTKGPAGYRKPDGSYVRCNDAYDVYIRMPDERMLFRLKRKKARCGMGGGMYRRVVDVQVLPKRRTGRCITVAHPNGLYITNDFIVTHNSDALLMAALQYVDVPGYSAILFRKTLTDLKQPGALLDRSMAWLVGTDAKWEASTHTWSFPTYDVFGEPATPSKITFGYIGESQAHLRYLGIEVQYCAYDEVTQHTEEDYRYLFSRLRKLACPIHKTEGGKTNYRDDCPLCQQQKNLPIRMRCATNPGGPGSGWVKRRFKIGPHIELRKAALTGEKVRYVGHEDKRPFIPSFAADNPYLDLESYASQLDELDPTTREQLKEGRWDVSPDSRFKRHWAKYYSKRGEYFCLGTEGTGPQHHADSLTRIFCTVDPASSSKHGPGDILTWKKEPSYTVISVWGLTRDYHLLWLDMVRFRREIPDVIMAMKTVNRHWRPDAFYVEANGLGQGVYQGATREGLPVQPVHTRVDKVVNASEAMIRMSQGRIWFPEVASWLSTAEDEVFFWTGDPIRTDDIVDSLSNAARQIAWDDPVVIPDNPETGTFEYSTNDLPTIIYDQEANGVDSPFGNY